MATILLDDTSSALTFSSDRGGDWIRIAGGQFYNGSSIYGPFATDAFHDTGNYAHLTVKFHGMSLAIYGHTPDAFYSQIVTASIDGGKPYNSSFDDQSPPSTIQWFQTPLLSDGEHTVEITHIASASVDLLYITAGQKTPLTGQRLIVDDSDSAIVYSGGWSRNTARFKSKDDPPTGLPFGNATHQTSSPGAVAAFPFSGTSIAVYSVFDFSRLGTMVVTFTLDSTSASRTFAVTDSSPEHASGLLQRENSLLFSKENLPSGDHTLTIKLDSVTNQALTLDYLVYTPSFPDLASKPSLAPPVVTSGTTRPPVSTNSAETGSGSSGATAPLGTDLADPVAGSNGNTKHTHVGAIVGGVVGGLALIVILVLLLLFRKRFFKRKAPVDDLPSAHGFIQAPPSVEPFVSAVSNNSPVQSTKYGYFYPSSTTINQPNPNAGWGSQSQVSDGTSDSQRHNSKAMLALSNPGLGAPLTPLRRDTVMQFNEMPGYTPGGSPMIRNRMQRLQDIMQEINNEIQEGRGDSVRVAILRGRMAELTREDVEGEGMGVGRALTPPPYEPQRA